MNETAHSLSAILKFRATLEASLYGLTTPISKLPISGFPRPGQLKQRPAAVLIGLLNDPVPSVLLTVRALHLAKHPGQIAFPGGGREVNDAGVVDTALREAEEETGMNRSVIEPLGLLGRYDTITGYRMTAVVGMIKGQVDFRPDRSEVDQVFSVPLAQVADPASFKHETIHYQDRDYSLLTLHHPQHRIWGATAALLYQLGQRIEPTQRWRSGEF